MVMLRRTNKLQAALPESPRAAGTSDTALGDWYVNRLVVDRKPLLLIVSSASLLPLIIPARDVRSLPDRLPEIVGLRLDRAGIPADLVNAELAAMVPVRIGKTADRSVLGILVDFAKSIPYYTDDFGTSDAALRRVEERLEETPCYVNRPTGSTVFPVDKTPQLLRARWGNAG